MQHTIYLLVGLNYSYLFKAIAGEWYSWASLCGHGFLLLPRAQFLYFFTHAIEVISSTIDTAVGVDGKMCDPAPGLCLQRVHTE